MVREIIANQPVVYLATSVLSCPKIPGEGKCHKPNQTHAYMYIHAQCLQALTTYHISSEVTKPSKAEK